MLDLGTGLGGACKPMRDRKWEVVGVDINPDFNPDIVDDIRTFSWNGKRPDLVWASPPCTDFSKFAMPCFYDVDKLPIPDMELVIACRRIIEECAPRYWVIENVRGAVRWFEPYLGPPRAVYNPFFLWGFFPPLGNVRRNTWGPKTKHLSSSAKAERAIIPYHLGEALAIAIERQYNLFE
jgi:site-specific DNA-cytosine methylase